MTGVYFAWKMQFFWTSVTSDTLSNALPTNFCMPINGTCQTWLPVFVLTGFSTVDPHLHETLLTMSQVSLITETMPLWAWQTLARLFSSSATICLQLLKLNNEKYYKPMHKQNLFAVHPLETEKSVSNGLANKVTGIKLLGLLSCHGQAIHAQAQSG